MKTFSLIRFALYGALLFPAWLQAQHVYTVQIHSASGVPLAGATVKTGKNLPAIAEAGVYNVKSSSDSLQFGISYSGYIPLDTLLTPGTHIVQLKEMSATLLPVEVRLTRAAADAPFSKTNLNESFISKNNLGADIPMLLAQTPSVVAHSDAGNGIGYTGLRIRGTDATRINMTINGIPYNDAESQGIFLVNLPDLLSSSTSIQVQRGVGTSSNGAGAFGASLNLSTHDYNPEAFGSVAASYGSFNSSKITLKGGTGLLGKHFTLDGRLSQIKSDGYIDRARTELQSGMFTAGWWGDRITVKANAILGKEKTYQAWYGVSEADLESNRTVNYAGTEKPGTPYDNETDNYWQNHYQLIINGKAANNWQWNTSLFTTTGKGYYEQYKAEESLADYGLTNQRGADGNVVETTDVIRRLWLDNIFFGQVFTIQKLTPKNEFGIGGGWNHYKGNHFGRIINSLAVPGLNAQWYDLDANKTDANLYAKLQRTIADNWKLFADGQYRFVAYNMDGFRNNPALKHEVNYHFFNPKLGISYRKNKLQGYLSYAVANKEPNRDDFEVSTTQLPKREQLHNVEFNFGMPANATGFGWALTNYLMCYKDQLILTGRVNDVGAYTRTNTPRSYRLGSEVELNYLAAKWNLRYSGTFSINRVKSFTEYVDDYDNGGQIETVHTNTPLALSPAILQQLSLTVKLINWLEVQWLTRHSGRQYLDNTGAESRSLDPFLVSDIKIVAGTAIKKLKNLQLIIQLNNVFNEQYEPNGYTFSYRYNNELTTENYYYPMAGFNFMAGFSLSF